MGFSSDKKMPPGELPVNVTKFNSYKDWECAVDRLSQAICLLDSERHVLRVNRVIESWGLRDVRQANGLDLHELLHPDCTDSQCALVIWLNWAWLQLSAQEIIAGDLWDSRLDRFLNIRLVNISRDKESCDANPERAVLATIEDIGNYKRAETEQYNLSVNLIKAQEQERKRIALDLHDGISQTLSAIKFSLEAEITHVPNKQPADIQSGLKVIVHKMRGALEDLRRISMDLWPSMLDDLGIISTIQWLVRDYQAHSDDIQWDLDIQLREQDIREELKITVFRILQESMSNAMKYSNASRVGISLYKYDDRICLAVEDNGQGFDLEKARLREGIGLRSIQERVDLTRGKIQILPSDKGTRVFLEW